ncbi:hypothetical protein A3L08_07835 [Thermococcus pacificus]|uniref:Uncharacterized protein n=2 Tax=Thermococcus pacificus TaxID=71998 RepID=A0A218P8W4_9EURY|nr:hypothetical protein A3L08_07835 [Thermococcus pacificus]
MLALEFEIPMERFNQVMDAIVWNDASIEWVYYNEKRGSAVFRLSVPRECLEWFLLRLAMAAGPLEVTITETEHQKTYIHEAFLIHLNTVSGGYPVVVLLEYYRGVFYPTDITIVTLPNPPQELIDSVMNLTIGRVRLSTASHVGRSVSNNTLIMRLKTGVAERTYTEHLLTVG